jgi:hypothetical protein
LQFDERLEILPRVCSVRAVNPQIDMIQAAEKIGADEEI